MEGGGQWWTGAWVGRAIALMPCGGEERWNRNWSTGATHIIQIQIVTDLDLSVPRNADRLAQLNCTPGAVMVALCALRPLGIGSEGYGCASISQAEIAALDQWAARSVISNPKF